MVSRLTEITIVEVIPLLALERVGCGMQPETCGHYKFEGGSDQMCTLVAPEEVEEIAEFKAKIEKTYNVPELTPMVKCGVMARR